MFRDIGSGTTRVHFFDNVGVPSRVLDRIEERFSVQVQKETAARRCLRQASRHLANTLANRLADIRRYRPTQTKGKRR